MVSWCGCRLEPSRGLLTAPRIVDSLAGRMGIVTLLPLSQSEIARHPPDNVVDRLVWDRFLLMTAARQHDGFGVALSQLAQKSPDERALSNA